MSRRMNVRVCAIGTSVIIGYFSINFRYEFEDSSGLLRKICKNLRKERCYSTTNFFRPTQRVSSFDVAVNVFQVLMWQLIYATRKLLATQKQLLKLALDGLSFLCGSPLQEAELPQDLQSVVHVRSSMCHDPVKTLYYSTDFADICIYCSQDMPSSMTRSEYFSQCEDCNERPKLSRRKEKNKFYFCIDITYPLYTLYILKLWSTSFLWFVHLSNFQLVDSFDDVTSLME